MALSRGSPRVGVTHHLALWCPDFPRRLFQVRRDRPVNSSCNKSRPCQAIAVKYGKNAAVVLILLPPSEGKTSPTQGKKLSLRSLSAPQVRPDREAVLNALVSLCGGPTSKALSALGLSASQVGEVARNASLKVSPTTHAIEVYTGVLYDALDVSSLSTKARATLNASVAIQSALFGVVMADDAIPAYRLSADSALPKIGKVATWWSSRLNDAMTSLIADSPVLDLRSGAYAAMWKPQGDVAHQVLVARVLLEERKGVRKVVSHHNKATKGRLVRALCMQTGRATTPEALAAACEKAGVITELHAPKKPGMPWTVDLVVQQI